MSRGLFLLATALLLACLLGLAVGEVLLGPADLWRGLLTGEGPGGFTLRVLRGPRVVTGALAGAALGMSGAIFQSVLRNPLAAPDVMGFTAGAGLGALAVAGFGAGLSVTLGAAAGGAVAAVAVALLALTREGLVPLRLVLVGIGAGFTLTALTGFAMTRLPGPEAMEAQRWLSGSLAARTWGHAGQIALTALPLALLAAALVPALALLEMGDDLAAGLGLRVQRARAGLAALGVALAAVAVAVAGPVPFIALMAGPLARGVLRRAGAAGPGAVLAGAALTGATIAVLADLAARAAVPGVQLPLGVMTGILGAPYLLWLLTREMERGGL